MAVRRLTRDDAAAARALYKAARDAGALDWWPGGTADLTVEAVRREIEEGAVPVGYFQPADTLRGFFLVRRACLPTIETTPPIPEETLYLPALEMYCWIVELGFTPEQYKAALDDLFNLGWFALAGGCLCWGQLPRDLIPANAKSYLDNRFAWHDYVLDGVVWRIWIPGVKG